MKTNKTIIYKIILVLILVILCFVMIYIGRGHTLYFDNKSMSINGVDVKAPYRIKIFIKGNEVADLNDGDRGMAIWIGPKAHLDVEIQNEKGGNKDTKSYDVKLPRKIDGVVINMVGLMNAAPYENYISEFIPLATSVKETEEELVVDDSGMEGLGFGE